MAAPKLSGLGRKLVLEGVLAGDSNDEIIGRLEALGVESYLTPQALSYYRGLPQVRAAVAQWEREALQVGIARRSVRLRKLSAVASRLEFRMVPKGGLEALCQPDYLDGKEMAVLDRYLRVLGMIQNLVGGAERRETDVERDVEMRAAQRRVARELNVHYLAEEALESADVLALDDPVTTENLPALREERAERMAEGLAELEASDAARRAAAEG